MLDEANALAPSRSKSSDGIIGDAAHAGTASDHNPDSRGIVHAIDLTHDPFHGWDCARRSEQIRLARDPRTLYVIFNGRWFHGLRGGEWGHPIFVWEPYHGSSPHAEHMHVSVEYGEHFENDVHGWWGGDDMTAEEHAILVKLAKDQAKLVAEINVVREDFHNVGLKLNAMDDEIKAIKAKVGA